MFEQAIAVNEFQLESFSKVVKDISEETLFQNAPGHGHSPVWLLGHLAIVGESGNRMLGGKIAHVEWLRTFGPGSVDKIERAPGLEKNELTSIVVKTYAEFRRRATEADPEAMAKQHTVSLLQPSPIRTVGDLICHLLTAHFSFHLSQLSSCRRSAGFAHIF
jgi:hypothetical protein